MIKRIFTIAILALVITAALAPAALCADHKSAGKGHVIFFFTAGMERQEYRTAYGEFVYSYEAAKNMLASEGYTYEFQSKVPVTVKLGEISISLGKENLMQSAGVVLVRPDGTFRVTYGIFKALDVLDMARKHFSSGRR